jgi:hypothetical protein
MQAKPKMQQRSEQIFSTMSLSWERAYATPHSITADSFIATQKVNRPVTRLDECSLSIAAARGIIFADDCE